MVEPPELLIARLTKVSRGERECAGVLRERFWGTARGRGARVDADGDQAERAAERQAED